MLRGHLLFWRPWPAGRWRWPIAAARQRLNGCGRQGSLAQPAVATHPSVAS